MTADKVREDRLRRMADRQGYTLRKSRRRDPRALDYQTYWLIDHRTHGLAADQMDLDGIERFLTGDR